MNTFKPLLILFAVFALWSCEKDETTVSSENFVAAFAKKSVSITDNSTKIQVVFSQPAPQNGVIQVGLDIQNLVYGTHFSTVPTMESGIIEIPVNLGDKAVAFTFNKLKNAVDESSVTFSILKVDFPNGVSQGNTDILVTYEQTASLGGAMAPNVGGPNEPHQVYIDLSNQTQTAISRDIWDLGFYTGNEFRVKLNSSLFMMAARLEATDIDAVTAKQVENLQAKMAFMVAGSNLYVDNPNGDISQTAIAEISSEAAKNKVYLLNLGSKIGTETPTTGSVALSGADRGWLKIRILQKNGGYLLQYAPVNETTHQEVFIAKNSTHHFSYFSFNTKNEVSIAPEKTNWDLCFTTATETLPLSATEKTAYGFSDYVKSNRLSQVKVYQVNTVDITYEKFGVGNIKIEKFEINQSTIGSSWRDVFKHSAYNDRYFVIQDANGNYYKLQFTALVNKNGERGYPEFKYELLQ